MDAWLTITGNVVAEPIKRLTKDGVVVTSFRLASTPRRLDRTTGEYTDGETLFVGVSCWRRLAENVADSLHRGDAVVVHGRMRLRSFVGSDGAERSVIELDAVTAGPDLSRGLAVFSRRGRTQPASPPADPVAPVAPAAAAEPAPDEPAELPEDDAAEPAA